MNRLYGRVMLALVVMATVISLQQTMPPLSPNSSAPSATPLATPRATIAPVSAAVRDLTVYAPAGRSALDQRAEVLFDH